MARTPDEEKRLKILNAAIESFCKLGYKNTTIKSISSQVGIAAGSVYTYFDDKKELYNAAINHIWEMFFIGLDRILHEESQVLKAVRRAYQHAAEFLLMSHALIKDMFNNKHRQEILRQNLAKTAAILTQYFSKHAEQLSFDLEDNELVVAIEIFLYGAFFQVAMAEPSEFSRLKERQAGIFSRILQSKCPQEEP